MGENTQFSQLHKVTPLSKYLAMAIFIALPFVGVFFGYTYAPEKIVGVEKTVVKEVAVRQPQTNPVVEPEVSLQQAVSVIHNSSDWPKLETVYDFSGTTSIPWYVETIIEPDYESLNTNDPSTSLDVCGFRRGGNYDSEIISSIEQDLIWQVGAVYNGMTYRGFECKGSEPWEQFITFVFSGDVSVRGIINTGLGPSRLYFNQDSADRFNFIPVDEFAPGDGAADKIWQMHGYGTKSHPIEITAMSDRFYYTVNIDDLYYVADLDTQGDRGYSVEFIDFPILGYEFHGIASRPDELAESQRAN